MIITVTERGTFRRCRQMWDWGSYNRTSYQPIVSKPALGIGHLWHATQAEWSLHPNDDPNELVKDLAVKEIETVSATYLQRIGAPISQVELDSLTDGIGMVMSMVKNYYERWGSPLPHGFRMVQPEQTCVVPIPGTEHTCMTCGGGEYLTPIECPECHGDIWVPHYLAGTLDGLIQDQLGRIYVLERKTYGARPKIETLNMQDQFLAYLWILRSLDIGEVGGLAYDGVWKRATPPKGSVLQDLFLRVLLNRNSVELDRFTVHLAHEAMEMANPDISIYPNRKWDGCWDCDFQAPCIAQERGEDYQYILNTYYSPRPKTEDSTLDLKTKEAE